MASETAASSKAPGAGIGFNLAAIAIVFALGGLALAYSLDNAGRQRKAQAAAALDANVVLTLGGAELTIPRVLLRYEEAVTTRFTDEIALRLTLPLGLEGSAKDIDITLVPRSRIRPSSSLLDGVYLHQFLPDELSGPPGLIGKPLRVGDGFENETVWYDALSADPFAAKCMAPVPGTTAERCLRTVLFENAAAIYAFDAEVLANWRRFDPEVEGVLKTIGVTR